MPRSRALIGGVALATLTVAASAATVRVYGAPFAGWGWREPAVALLALEAILLTVIAVLSVPFEPRLRRWSQPNDPLAIGYQLDLSAAELNAPAQQTSDSRWLWMALPPLLGAVGLGAWLLLTTAPPDNEPRLIPQSAAVATARGVVARSPGADPADVARNVEVSTYALTLAFFGERAQPVNPPADPDTLVYDVWFGPSPTVADPTDDPFSGPHVVVNAEDGEVVMTSGLAR